MNYTIDYYHILAVSKTATKEELKASYRRLVKLHHPDKNPGDAEATSRFQLIQEAYEILSNDISRHVYDEYRAAHEPTEKQQAANKPTDSPKTNSTRTYETKTNKFTQPNSRTFTQIKKIWREKRIYVQGRINVKFQGESEIVESYMSGREQDYTIYPTETLLTILSSGIYKDGTPKEYEKAYSSAELFAVPLPQPLRCQMMVAGVEEFYELTVHNLKIKDPTIINSTHHEQDNFGELTGDCYGYVVHRYEEEVTETFTEYYGATGQVETKESAGVYFSRQEFYHKDGSVYWGEWNINTSATARSKTTTTKKPGNYATTQTSDISWKYVLWLIYLLITFIIWPKLMLVVLLLSAVLFLLYAFAKIADHQARLLPWLSALLIFVFLGMGINALMHPLTTVVQNKTRQYQPLDTHKQPLNNDKNNHDTLISHLVQWTDYDSNRYEANLLILQSAVIASHNDHQSMPFVNLTADRVGEVYANMYHMDKGRLEYVYQAFDSIAKAKQLNEMQAAEMVVSCVQSIPYFLIVDGSCGANYNDAFITHYLRNCQDDCCLGDVKFGVQSPAEFIGDLKGDCDTRALVLFDILSKMGYDVAVLTSQYYKHALIAVHFKNNQLASGVSIPVKGDNYYFWETTSTGHKPGVIPGAISNINYWTTSLLHQQ